ncbi:uncharacterized protein LOC103720192 [Phoenix dactylifera]|uniref:Uncharacterized protein LOC103720192 n=1 Tax=Phoenix dactylifera TaxID=42345 RepID=A0A8B7CWQ7_PHODC|nr:uncharacterized protein LOC103720192 [Phoenix dactylifera]
MADGGLMLIDGNQLRDGDLRLPLPGATVTGAHLVELAESEAAARLFGLSLPESLRSAALRRMAGDVDIFLTEEFSDAESMKQKLEEYLVALADELKDDPLVVLVLDGSAIRIFLDDEDDFAMLAENLFTELDVDDKGKLGKNEIQNALVHMGVEMGVPPFPETNDLLKNILKKHGAEGGEQLGQAQFAQLLQAILQDLADALAKKHVTFIQNVKVFNGSKLKKILADKELFDNEIEGLFQDWIAYRSGEGNKETLQGFFVAKGRKLGLPPPESNEAVLLLYDQIFSVINDITGDLTRVSFQEVVKNILEKFVEQLEANPMFIDMGSGVN